MSWIAPLHREPAGCFHPRPLSPMKRNAESLSCPEGQVNGTRRSGLEWRSSTLKEPTAATMDGMPIAIQENQTAGVIAAVKTLLLIDLIDSTGLLSQLGDARSQSIFQEHDHLARSLLARFDGREIDKTDGFLLLFDRPIQAVGYALEYQRELSRLGERL